MEVGRHRLFLLGGGAVLPPVGQGGVVVGAGVDHTVLDVVVGQILAVPAAEGELQHLHAGETALRQQFPDAGGQLAQVLGNNGQLPQGGFQGVEQLHPGADLPLAGAGGGAGGRDGPVCIKTPEVVDPDQVVDAQGVADPLNPPGKAGLPVVGPVIEGVAPELALGREVIRRAARHPGELAVGVQLKEPAAHPGVHRVGRNIDGQVAQDLDALAVGVSFQGLPLAGKLVLQEFPETDLLRVFPGKPGQSLPVPQPVFPGPGRPGRHLVGGLEGHIEGVVIQPALVFEGKGVVIVGVIGGAAVLPGTLGLPGGVGGPQQRVAGGVEGAVIHHRFLLAELRFGELCGGEQALGFQPVQVDEIGVARKGRTALVGAVTVAGGAQGQDLPDGLAGLGQKVHEFVGGLPEAADPIGSGKAGNRHQDSTFTHRRFPHSVPKSGGAARSAPG